MKCNSALPTIKSSESGATSIEYAFIASIISITIVAGATLIGANLGSIFGAVAAGL